jgi:glycosyltransferase involved in cell wall biosynthesis
MNAVPLVSVVLPFLDAERFLGETIESVLAQTFPHWELWLVDDGSTDGSTGIARLYARRDARVRVLEHEGHANRGVSASRNLGIAHARGAFVALLDADDVFLPEKLERQVEMLQQQPEVGMVYGRSLYWYGWTGDRADAAQDRVQEHRIRSNVVLEPPQALVLHLTGRAAVPCPCSVLARTTAVRAVGGFEESFRRMYEDQVFYAKMGLQHPVFVSDTCLDRYRQHPDSICSAAERSGELLAARRIYLEWLIEYLLARRVRDAQVWQAVRQESWLAREHASSTPEQEARRRYWDKWRLRVESALLSTGAREALWRRRVPALAEVSSPHAPQGNPDRGD